jgi:hypothetical protein
LESFLLYGKISHIPLLHDLMFKIYSRIIFHKEENKELSEAFNIEGVIYDHYLIDTLQFFDLISIFPNHASTIKKMINVTYNFDYEANF